MMTRLEKLRDNLNREIDELLAAETIEIDRQRVKGSCPDKSVSPKPSLLPCPACGRRPETEMRELGAQEERQCWIDAVRGLINDYALVSPEKFLSDMGVNR